MSSSGPCLYFSQAGILPTNHFTWGTSNGFNGRIFLVVCNSGDQSGSTTITITPPSSPFTISQTSVDTGTITPGNCVEISVPISGPPLQFPNVSLMEAATKHPTPSNLPPGTRLECTLALSCLNLCTGVGSVGMTVTLGSGAGAQGCNKYGFPSGSGTSVYLNLSFYVQACQFPTQFTGGGGFIPSPPSTQQSSQSQPSTQQKQVGGSYTPPGAQPTASQPQPNAPPQATAAPNQPAIYAVAVGLPDISFLQADPNVKIGDPSSAVAILEKAREYFRGLDEEYSRDLEELESYIQSIQAGQMVATQATPQQQLPPGLAKLVGHRYIRVYKLQPNQPVSDVIEVPPVQRSGTHTGALMVIYFVPTTMIGGTVGMSVKGAIVPFSATSTNTTQSGAAVSTFTYDTVFVPQISIDLTGTSSATGVPGQTITLQYTVMNNSNVPVTITLKVTDPYGTEITQTNSAPACSSSPCPSVTFNINYTIPPTLSAGAQYTVTASATATYQSATSSPVTATTTINVVSQQQMSMTAISVVPSQTFFCVTPGSTVSIGATVTNTSGTQQQVTVELLDQANNVITSQQVTVPAQGSSNVTLNFVAPTTQNYYFYQVAAVVGSTTVNSAYVAVDVSTTCASATTAPAAVTTTTTQAAVTTQQMQQLMNVMLVMMLFNMITSIVTAVSGI